MTKNKKDPNQECDLRKTNQTQQHTKPQTKDRLLTHDVMAKCHITCDMRCVMWSQCPTEMAVHLLFSRRYAVHF
jgi:hypothetical protein